MLKERIPNINDVDLEDDDVLKQLIADCQVRHNGQNKLL